MNDARRIVLGGGVQHYTINKQPSEVFLVEVDCGPWISGRSTLTSFTATITPAGPTITPQTKVGDVAPFLIAAGTDAYTGLLTFKATYGNGEIKEAEFSVSVHENI